VTFLERLQAHHGGLIRLKTELYWCGGRGWDKNPGRLCLLLEATAAPTGATFAATSAATRARSGTTAALLLVDGSPQWIWVVDGDVEVISEAE